MREICLFLYGRGAVTAQSPGEAEDRRGVLAVEGFELRGHQVLLGEYSGRAERLQPYAFMSDQFRAFRAKITRAMMAATPIAAKGIQTAYCGE